MKKKRYLCVTTFALVVKLVDTPDLGSGASRRVGSSPIRRTLLNIEEFPKGFSSFLCP